MSSGVLGNNKRGSANSFRIATGSTRNFRPACFERDNSMFFPWRKSLVFIVGTSIVMVMVASSGLAADRVISITPGSSVVLAKTADEIKVLPGSGAVVVSDDKAKLNYLIYSAKNPSVKSQETVAYTIGTTGSETIDVVVDSTPQLTDPQLTSKSGKILFSMLMLAIILESAFALLFNWRVFLEFFDQRGMRTIVMFMGALAVVNLFKLDLVSSLFQIYSAAAAGAVAPSDAITKLLTALVLAGGSASVNQLLVALNLRQSKTIEQITPKPPPTKAWVSVKVNLKDATRLVDVTKAENPIDVNSPSPLLAVIGPQSILMRLKKYFWRDVSRAPRSGGIEVDPRIEYTILVKGRDAQGAEIICDASGQRIVENPPRTFTPQPRSYVFAQGAIIDFTVTL